MENKKRIIILLKRLSEYMEKDDFPIPMVDLVSNYSDEELKQVILYRYADEWTLDKLSELSRLELKKIIDGNFLLVLWTINKLEKELL